ncbi:eukaryotic translation initiation factor eIF2A-domain-containing protein [Naematelia encephala]|uniref:Eukaryotic translation initiation factor 2A n=1 Tax=Naematelia encephala TaxID=71784 RepID=A0A1Y2AL68_9TREE|nr:eukaryotic translation initiation factor eIF2A-domain-containing protein [Naematelia encephala]
MSNPQYAFRAQKTTGVAEGSTWAVGPQIPVETSAVRCYAYSPDGEWLAYATASEVQLLPSSSSSSSSSRTFAAPNVVALAFSPLSTYMFTFERPVKSETDVHKNVKAYDIKTGQELSGWYHRTSDDWEPIVTADESYLIRPGASDLSIFTPPLAPRPSTRLRVEGSIKGLFLSSPSALPAGTTSAKPVSPASEPALAVWLGERKGAPASVALYSLSSLIGKGNADADKPDVRDLPMTTARKAFYKADKLSVKWNAAGTMALFLTHTDVDATGKSYYGETNLYLVSLDGSFDGLVDLDKEGPIYDFTWSPTSREFVVCYGYMPARVQLFDMKAKPLHSFGAQHRNFLSYQPQGRLLLSAGFGNLAGGVDIWDVSTRNKVAEFKASNSSHCEWSPCGRYILTATLSPRLRVDNEVKIWWCGGQLLHIHPQDELYQASFRPLKISNTEPFPAVMPKAPAPNDSVALYRPKGDTSTSAEAKPAGAYRPPGARGTVASDAYRVDESTSNSGTSTPTPMFKGGKPSSRYIPGAPPPGSAPPASQAEDKKKRVRSKRPLKENGGGAPVEEMEKLEVTPISPPVPVEEDPAQKKIRGLQKKLRAIDELKEKLAKGEQMEKTQLKKIETEASIRAEITALGGSP